MTPRTDVISNQSRPRRVWEALAMARSMAWVTPSVEEPVISTDLYTWSLMRQVSVNRRRGGAWRGDKPAKGPRGGGGGGGRGSPRRGGRGGGGGGGGARAPGPPPPGPPPFATPRVTEARPVA